MVNGLARWREYFGEDKDSVECDMRGKGLTQRARRHRGI